MEKHEAPAAFDLMRAALNERQWRIYLAVEAKKIGRGGISQVARAARTTRKTIRKGIAEVEGGRAYVEGDRIRGSGGGRKSLRAQDPTLLADLEALLDPKGDPMSLLKWTTKSISHLHQALHEQGHTVAQTTIRRLLRAHGYTLRANKKEHEGVSAPDRDSQFAHIKEECARFEEAGQPIISVDCKKKELLGNFKNNGQEWQPKGQPVTVNVYDFLSLADGKAIPYGVYDVLRNTGFVNVGQDHDTAAFAVESIRRWWRHHGQDVYPTARELLIVADGGGSNSARGRLWKKELQGLAIETGLTVRVCHLPPGTSKWNKIEHKLFSYISINWRARPLTSMETVIELISCTTTAGGLTVTAVADTNAYPTKIPVPNAELQALNLVRDAFHGDWNYALHPS
ncbi:MAG: ISAzo13 family transposase [Acidimicrobiales bacterium]